MTRLVLGPCSPFSVSTDLLKESAKLARAYEVPLHTHLCETMDEERYTLERYQLRPVAWMATLDWMGSDVWFAHAIHVDDDEIRELARADLQVDPLQDGGRTLGGYMDVVDLEKGRGHGSSVLALRR